MVLWYTRGYIPDISPRGCGGLAGLRTGFNKIYQSPKLTHSWSWYAGMHMPILSHAIIGDVLLDMNLYTWYAGLHGLSPILLFLLWPYRHFASRAALPLGLSCLLVLPLGLLCLLGYFSSWACLLGYFASWACLLGYFASWDVYRHFAS
jgi:hypothetical protein